MGRVMAIDFGSKRTGIAVTDPLKIIASGLDTIETDKLIDFLDNYFLSENVEKVVLGLPKHKDGNYTYLKKDIDQLSNYITVNYSSIEVDFYDETNTSIESKKIIMSTGTKKSKRQDKALVDKISAVLILQKYLGHI